MGAHNIRQRKGTSLCPQFLPCTEKVYVSDNTNELTSNQSFLGRYLLKNQDKMERVDRYAFPRNSAVASRELVRHIVRLSGVSPYPILQR